MSGPELSPKAILRAQVLAERDRTDVSVRARLSERIAERGTPILRDLRPPVLAAYWAIRSECDPSPLVERARRFGSEIALPIVQPDGLSFRRWREGERLTRSTLGTYVPSSVTGELRPHAILVPLAAFDRKGMRIGYGLGYYDRSVTGLMAAGHRPTLIGLAFAFQEVAAVPAEPHDVKLDYVVTDAELIICPN